MLIDNQVAEFLSRDYQKSILSQIPPSYSPENVVLNITLKLDLAKIFRSNRFIATALISQFPSFQASAQKAIIQFMKQQGLTEPEHGIHLMVKVINCPLPVQNIKSAEFQLASFQQPEGIMVYLKDLLVMEVSQQEIFLFSATEIWSAKCQCNDRPLHQRHFTRSLANVIQANASQEDKLKNTSALDPYLCDKCSKQYYFVGRENQIFLNCQKIRCMLPRRDEKEAIFESRDFVAYGELSLTAGLKPGLIISCCAYLFYRPAVVKVTAKQPISVKSQSSALLINIQIHSREQNLLTIRPENNQFFYQLSKISLTQKPCLSLTDSQTLLHNYENLLQSLNKFRFSYLPPSMLTTLKLSLLNSICNHHANRSLHFCLITEDLQLALRLMYVAGVDVKRWPSQFDGAALWVWLRGCRGCVVIVVGPTKKDLQLLEQYFSNQMVGFENIAITFWLLCQTNPKKDINIDNFAIVLDLTTEKNINVCKQAIEESIDLKLQAFVAEDFDCPMTIAKVKNPRARIQMIEKRALPVSEAEKEQEQAESKHILQSYYLKCRDLKKTSSSTLSYLYQLAQGFSYLRAALNAQSWLTTPTTLTLLDSILAIFLDEQSARNKHSNSNTIFGIEISKLILNEQDCEISFWDYVSQEDGTMTERKGYMSKGDMFRKMVGKLHLLLFQDDLVLSQ